MIAHTKSLGDSRNRLFQVLVLCLLFASLLFRSIERLRNPSLWAEDGLFLEQALAKGWASLLDSYAGYFHTVPRLVTIFSSFTGAETFPLSSLLVCLFILALVCWRITFNDFSHFFPTLKERALIALGLTFVGGLREVVGNPTNLHWFLSFYVLLLGLRKLSAKVHTFEIGLFLLCLLSAGETSVLLLLFAGRALLQYRKKLPLWKESLGLALCILIIAALNFLVREESTASTLPALNRLLSLVKYLFVQHFMLQPVLGDFFTAKLAQFGKTSFWIVSVALVLIWIKLLQKSKDRSATQLLLLALVSYLGLGVLMALVRDVSLFYFTLPERRLDLFQDRYATVFSGVAFLFWAATLSLCRFRNQSYILALYVAVYIAAASPYRFFIPPHNPPALTWKEQLARAEFKNCDEPIVFAISPQGHAVTLPSSFVFKARCQTTK